MKSINWKDHLVNLVVVILGISVAFWLESWKESRATSKQEEVYLESLLHDLQTDLERLDTMIVIDQFRGEMLNKLAAASVSPDSVGDSIAIYLHYLQHHPEFSSQNATIETIKASGNSALIDDFQLRMRVIGLYGNYYEGIRQYDLYVTNYTSQFLKPFVINHVQYQGVNRVDPSFLVRSDFRNMIFSLKAVFTARIDMYKLVKEELESLIAEIKTYRD